MYIPHRTPHQLDLFYANRQQRATQLNKQIRVRYICNHFQIEPSEYMRIKDQKMLAYQLIKQRKNCLGIYKPSGVLVSKIEPHELQIIIDGKQFYIVITSEKQQIQDIVSKIKKTDLLIATFRYASDYVYPKILSMQPGYYKPYYKRPSQNLRRLIEKGPQIGKQDVLAKEVLNFRVHSDLKCGRQQAAIHASGRFNIMIIDGPAGTGKTKISCQIAIQFSLKGKKVIMGAATHAATRSIADHILQEIIEESNYNGEIHLMQAIRNFMMYYQMQQSNQKQQLKGKEAEIKQIIKKIDTKKQQSDKLNVLYFDSLMESKEYFTLPLFLRYFSFNSQVLINLIKLNEQQSILNLFINLDKVARKQETTSQFHEIYKAAVRLTIKKTNILITNTAKAPQINDYQRQDEYFVPELAILDEARQATLIDAYCLLSLDVKRLILLGDIQQLSTNPKGNYQALNTNPLKIFDQSQHIPRYSLLEQYRMHPEIYQFSRVVTYGKQIENGLTKNTIGKHISKFLINPLLMVTHYAQEQYPQDPYQFGLFNVKQIMIIKLYIDLLKDEDLKNVGIMTFYRAQASRMKLIFADQIKLGLTISAVDGYQGGERDYIFLSAVRSIWSGVLGFVQDKNRVNVAFTRARKALVIVGNAATLQFGNYDNIWKIALNYLHQRGKIYQLGQDWEDKLQKQKHLRKVRDPSKFRQAQILDDEELENLNPEEMKKLHEKAIANITKYEIQDLPFVKSRYN